MVLKRGDAGQEVKELQENLIALGYGRILGPMQNDGRFGKRTENAVKAFQLAHGMPDNGIADTATQEQMVLFLSEQERSAPLKPPSATALGEAIARSAAGHVGVKEDGKDNMGAAIARYKAATGNKTTDGPWCADFTSFVLQQEVPGLVKPSPVAKNLMAQFSSHGALKPPSVHYTPKEGDLVFFDRGTAKNPWMGHVGIVTLRDEHGRPYTDGKLHTIEGNKADPRFDGKTEGVDYAWSKDIPDAVRRVSYSAQELKEARLLGYGSVEVMAQYDPRHHNLPTPTTIAGMSTRGNKPQKL